MKIVEEISIRKWKYEDSKIESVSLFLLRNKVNEMGQFAENRSLYKCEFLLWLEDKLKLLDLEHSAILDLE